MSRYSFNSSDTVRSLRAVRLRVRCTSPSCSAAARSSNRANTPGARCDHCLLNAMSFRQSSGLRCVKTSTRRSYTSSLLWRASSLRVRGGLVAEGGDGDDEEEGVSLLAALLEEAQMVRGGRVCWCGGGAAAIQGRCFISENKSTSFVMMWLLWAFDVAYRGGGGGVGGVEVLDANAWRVAWSLETATHFTARQLVSMVIPYS